MLAAGRHRLFVGVCFAACVVADMGDDLANNLPADLAPLLSLFGERVTMQFISQSTGWADHIILAVAPLGIITVIVCAIRVGGPTWLRAIIGRARESFAVVEAEVMSSTSHEVCELWNGQEVVRVMGEGLIREFIIMVPAGSDWDGNSATVETKDQDEYLNERGFTIQERIFGKLDIEEGIGHAGKDGLSVVIIRRKETEDIAPNLTLNIHSRVGRGELYAVALFGILVQLGILAYYACSTYYSPFRFHLLNKGDVIESYAFSCTAAGTTLIVAGMLICSLIVEKSTSEKRYLPISKANEARVVWLQRPGTVNDQTFESFAIYPESPQAVITTSRRASRTRSQGRETSSDKSWWECVSGRELNEVLTLMGMFFSISGFIVQFVGLRAMHWTASVTLLGATILMTCLRVLVRRNLAQVPKSQRLLAGHELDWLTRILAGDVKNAPWMGHPKVDEDGLKRPCADRGGWDWRVSSVENPETLNKLCPSSDTYRHMKPQQINQSVGQTLGLAKQAVKAHNKAMKIREDLGGLANWHGPAYAEAIVLARAIEMTMDTLLKPHPANPLFTWSLTARWPCGGTNSESIDFLVRLENQKWKVSSNEIDAALSLWLYSVYKDENILGNIAFDGAGVRTTEMMEERNLRLLGSHTPALHRDLRWWMPDGAIRVIAVGSDSSGQHHTTVEVKPHQVVGFASNPELGSAEGRIYLFETFNDTPRDTSNGNGTLAVESYSPLKTIYTQHMFSAFMWALAKAMEPIPTRAEIRLKDTDGLSNSPPWQFLSFHNTTLSKLAKNIQSTGLGSLEEVYLAIIPPLSAWNKLPRADAIVEWTREHTKRHEQLGHWKEATDAYLWLFEVSKTFSEQSNKATAVLMEYLRTVTLAVELKGAQAYGEEDTKRLMKEKWRLETKMKTADQEVLSSLMRLYAGEGRGWKCDVVQGIGSGVEEDLPYPKVFNFVSLHQSVRRNDINGISKILEDRRSEGPDPKDIHDCTPLHYAAAMGCKKAAEELLRGGAHVNAGDLVDWTPLHHASANGYEDVVGLLIELGADEHSRDRFDGTPLHVAAANGHKEVASLLIQQGADTDFRDCSGGTPLHRAAASGHKDVVSLLVAKGADKEVKDRFGETPAYRAAKAGHKDTVIELLGDKMSDLVQTLLSHAAERGHKTVVRLAVNGLGAEKNVKDRSGRTPLHSAAAKGHKAVVRLLIKEGADKNATDSSGETALCYAVKAGHVDIVGLLASSGGIDVDLSSAGQTPLSYAAEGGNEAIARLLLDSGKADINARSSSGRTPLSYAAEGGSKAIVKLLLDSGKVDIDSKDSLDRVPLSYAAERGHEAIVKLLLDSGKVDVDSKTSLDRTPLSYASERGSEAVVRLLLNSGKVDIDSSSKSGRTPLSYAAEGGREAVVRLLLSSGKVDIDSRSNSGQTPLSYAAERGHEAIVKLLLDSGNVDVDSKTSLDRTPLSYAAERGHAAIVGLLLDSVKVDINVRSSSGQTPLSYAAESGREAVARLLLSSGKVDIDSQDGLHRTPLSYAAEGGRKAIVKLLLDSGKVDIDSKDSLDRVPLSYAAEKGHEAVVGLLLDSVKVDINVRSSSGRTPLSYAAERGSEAVVGLLLDSGKVDVDSRSNSGRTPLSYAAEGGHEAIVGLLLNSDKVHIDSSSKSGRTPLSYAAERGQDAVIGLLLDSGNVDMNSKDSLNRTPLSYAAERGHEAIVGLLLDSVKVDINVRSSSGRTPLSYAAEGGHEAVVGLLLDSGKVDIDSQDGLHRTPLSYSAEVGSKAIVGLLLDSGKVNLDSRSNSGRTPLSYAAERGHDAVIKLLLGSGGVDIESKSKGGWTPLSYAAKGGHEAVVGLFLDSDKADISTRSDLHTRAQPGKTTIIASERFDGNGPSSGRDITWYGQFVCKPGQSKKLPYFYDRHLLADAVYYGKWKEVKELLDHGRWKYHQDWVNCWRILPSTETGRTTSGFTPLHQAAWWGNERVVQELLQMGAWRLARTLRNTSDSEGHSRPLDIARGRKWEHLYEFLDPEIKRPLDPKVLQVLQDRLHSLIRQTFGDNRQAHLECFILPEIEVLTEFKDSGMWFPLSPELPDSRQELAVHISLEHDELIVIIQLGRNERRNYRISSTGVTQFI